MGSLTGASIRKGAWGAGAAAVVAMLVLGTGHSMAVVVLASACVAFPMGIPFPAGLRHLQGRAPGLVPWALALNGCASVAAFSLAPVLASDIAFSGLILVGAAIYGVIGLIDVSCQKVSR